MKNTPAHDRNRIRWLLLGVAAGLLLLFWKIPLDPALWNTWVVLRIDDSSVMAINGRGKTRVLFPASENSTYSQPFSWSDRGFGAVVFVNGQQDSLVFKNIQTGLSGSLLPPITLGRNLRASPSGNRFAFLNPENNNLVVYEGSRKMLDKKNLQRFFGYENEIGWVSENALVIITNYREENGAQLEKIYLVNVENEEEELICVSENIFLEFEEWVRPKSKFGTLLCNGRKEIAALFGSIEHPARFLLPSNGSDQYYFYLRSQYSFFLGYHRWIEGYDRKTGRTFTVKTLQWFGSA